jgi:hypothetical protein
MQRNDDQEYRNGFSINNVSKIIWAICIFILVHLLTLEENHSYEYSKSQGNRKKASETSTETANRLLDYVQGYREQVFNKKFVEHSSDPLDTLRNLCFDSFHQAEWWNYIVCFRQHVKQGNFLILPLYFI